MALGTSSLREVPVELILYTLSFPPESDEKVMVAASIHAGWVSLVPGSPVYSFTFMMTFVERSMTKMRVVPELRCASKTAFVPSGETTTRLPMDWASPPSPLVTFEGVPLATSIFSSCQKGSPALPIAARMVAPSANHVGDE